MILDLIFTALGVITGVLLDDLLVAEDSRATSAASDKQSGRAPVVCADGDARTVGTFSVASSYGGVVVEPPLDSATNGDTSKEMGTEHDMLQEPRHVSRNLYVCHNIQTIKT